VRRIRQDLTVLAGSLTVFAACAVIVANGRVGEKSLISRYAAEVETTTGGLHATPTWRHRQPA
jgi:hypothetical protein